MSKTNVIKNYTFKILSMNKVHYLEKWENCTGETKVTPNIKYTLNCIEKNGRKLQINLFKRNGSCDSGYCDAAWGECETEWVTEFGGYTHSIKKELAPYEFSMDFAWDEQKNDFFPIKNYISGKRILDGKAIDVFFGIKISGTFTATGDEGNCYYPDGYVWVNENLFTPTARYEGKAFIYVFYGDSATGKSFLSGLLSKKDFIVFETDAHEILPEKIEAEIIVVGNKYKFDLNDIKHRIPFDAKIVEVNFHTA